MNEYSGNKEAREEFRSFSQVKDECSPTKKTKHKAGMMESYNMWGKNIKLLKDVCPPPILRRDIEAWARPKLDLRVSAHSLSPQGKSGSSGWHQATKPNVTSLQESLAILASHLKSKVITLSSSPLIKIVLNSNSSSSGSSGRSQDQYQNRTEQPSCVHHYTGLGKFHLGNQQFQNKSMQMGVAGHGDPGPR